MKRNIYVIKDERLPVGEQAIEMVERKGVGHPDYIADSAAEAVSKALSRYYLQNYGVILHHNVDKGIVVGGRSVAWFGGGRVLEPIYIMVAGRATTTVKTDTGEEHVPIGPLAISAIKEFLTKNFRFLNVEEHVIIDYKIRPGSRDLRALLEQKKPVPDANDTSVGVGYAPLTPTERLVYETERYLNSPRTKKELPELGEDIKVMGLRIGKTVKLSIAIAMISHLIPDAQHYESVREEVVNKVADLAARITEMPVEIYVNTADKPELNSYYLTVTGTSAEAGDDGNTGRGNRANGLITPFRPMSMEATAGKNPINHVGKVYNVAAFLIADRAYKEAQGIKCVTVKILSQIGRPIDQPLSATALIVPEKDTNFNTIKSDVEAIIDDELSKITRLTKLILEDKVQLF